MEEADGVIIATPEHNHSIPSALKSVLEWLSFKVHPFDGKPVMIIGVSYDVQGSSRAQLHLRQILDAPGVNATVMPGNEFLLGRAHEAFDEQGNLVNKGTIDFLESCFRKFMRFTDVANILNIPEDVTFEPGEYTVTAPGHNGDLPMVVTLSSDRIESIEIDSSGESAGIADVVFTRIPQEIVEGQTLNVDIISGRIRNQSRGYRWRCKSNQISWFKSGYPKETSEGCRSTKAEEVQLSTDVLVIGGGGAGLSAAATALQEGKKVPNTLICIL